MLRELLAMPRLTSLCLEQVSLCMGLEEQLPLLVGLCMCLCL